MVANTRCVVASAAGSLKHGNAAFNQASGCHIVVNAGDAADGNLQRVKELLTLSNGAPRRALIVLSVQRPCVVEVENVGCEPPVARSHQPARLLEAGKQKMDAGIDGDKEGFGST